MYKVLLLVEVGRKGFVNQKIAGLDMINETTHSAPGVPVGAQTISFSSIWQRLNSLK